MVTGIASKKKKKKNSTLDLRRALKSASRDIQKQYLEGLLLILVWTVAVYAY